METAELFGRNIHHIDSLARKIHICTPVQLVLHRRRRICCVLNIALCKFTSRIAAVWEKGEKAAIHIGALRISVLRGHGAAVGRHFVHRCALPRCVYALEPAVTWPVSVLRESGTHARRHSAPACLQQLKPASCWRECDVLLQCGGTPVR